MALIRVSFFLLQFEPRGSSAHISVPSDIGNPEISAHNENLESVVRDEMDQHRAFLVRDCRPDTCVQHPRVELGETKT